MKRPHAPTPTLFVALLALVIALSGTSYAAKLLTGKDIKNNSITSKDVKNKSLKGTDVKDGSLTGADVRNGSLGSADLADGSVSGADLAPGVAGSKAIARQRVVATAGASEAAARAAAPETVLFSQGSISVVAKCYTDTSGPDTYSAVYLKTSQDGAVFDSRDDSLEGGSTAADFLNTTTPETDREVESDSAGLNSASMGSQDDSDFVVFAPDGTTVRGFTGAAVKNGTLAGGNGVYGAGDVCLFTGAVFAN